MKKILSDEHEMAPFLLFRVHQHLCALPLTHVVETMRPLPVEAITGTPDAVKGLAVIRGVSVPVVDLGYLLDGEGGSPTRLVTVRTGTNHVALAVEAVVGLHYLSADMLREIPPLLSEAGDRAVALVGALDTELLLVLDTAYLVSASLWQAINVPGENT